jgi:CheY-like chemotaxis protein
MNGISKLKVLVADDEQVIANTLAMILTASEFEARAVYSGEGAVEMARTFHPDVLISDVIMPGKSGIEAAIEVLAMLPACKILLFSGQAATAALLSETRARVYGFEVLSKPIHPKDLLARLHTACAAN